ncbi:MAG: GNAT family N-acetyltransferase [Acidimicrobiia bacterium]|nr:GNAT family N-acetyltransferase [Acidimicrobiia bacterium]
MSFEIRVPTDSEIPAFRRAIIEGFSDDAKNDEERVERFRKAFELDRFLAAYDGDDIVGTFGAFSFDMAVPGGTLGTAGTTIVTVRPTHRRQGLLTSMMDKHLVDAADRGEPLAALWASESSIYGRFGYGMAVYMNDVSIESDRGAFRPEVEISGRVRLVDADEAKGLLPPVYEQVWRERPGTYARSESWWENRWFRDDEEDRGGATGWKYAIHETDGVPRGFARYRVKLDWGPFPNNEVRLGEIQGVDASSRLALWRFLLDIDLAVKVKCWNQPADLEVPWALAEHRRLMQRRSDGLWVRILDVEQALAGRKYRVPGSIVIDVTDQFRPATSGAYRLDIDDSGAASCTRTDEAPQLTLSMETLGSIYLGGIPVHELANAGLITGDQEAIELADLAFGWGVSPFCPEIF